ncbi:hypothetical protein [Actinomyces sp. ZJ308]|uniref:hypothetical protein n=1 Tax=Actinomyces sp. ZJ308 TaxID=2708342 RepID=UPI001FB99F6A|nr:hypothetical protein [Actinomyces sp. ZJ308]
MSSASASSNSATSSDASGGASADASSAAGSGPVTAESLSDPDLGYTVVSIPEGLDATQTKILQDYIAYDKATWKLWFTNEGVDEISSVATGDVLEEITTNAENRNGVRAKPPIRISVSEVTMESSDTANVSACVDRTKMTRVDAQGKDITKESDQVQTPATVRMVNESGGGWLAENEDEGAANSCSV